MCEAVLANKLELGGLLQIFDSLISCSLSQRCDREFLRHLLLMVDLIEGYFRLVGLVGEAQEDLAVVLFVLLFHRFHLILDGVVLVGL